MREDAREASRCAGCPWKSKCIGSRGPVDSPFVIVGESPGSQELAQGVPFVGPSGVLLNEVLDASGFSSLGIEPYVLNALSCCPTKKDIPIMKSAAQSCQSRLLDEIRAHPRQVILCLGAAASWSVTNDFSLLITRDRGRVISVPFAEKGAVLAVHPAFLMRRGTGLPTWKKDVRQAVKLLRGESLGHWREPTWHVLQRPSEVKDLVDEYIDAPLITGDVETDNLHWFDGRMLCLGVTKDDGSHVDIIPEHILYSMMGTLKPLLEESRWNWHNGLFDIKWFRKLGVRARVDEDNMLMSYAMNENPGIHDLDQVAQHWIGAPKHKQMLDKYLLTKKTSYREVPSNVLYKYAAIDISKTHASWLPMHEALVGDPMSEMLYNDILIPAVDFIAEMQLYGVEVDQDKVRENERAHQEQIEAILTKIQPYAIKHLGKEINMNSPMQIKELIYAKMELGPTAMSTNEQSLIQVKRKHEHPIIDLILDYREVQKRKSTYVSNILDGTDSKGKPRKGVVKADGRIHADYKIHGTQTGRLAGAEPNMLNQPRGPLIRSQYKAGEKKIFVEVDLNQAELRSLALLACDPILMDIYTRNEVSVHDVTTAAFYGSKEDLAQKEGLYEHTCLLLHKPIGIDPAELYKEAKMRGKAVNFGIVYGREAFSLAREFDITIAEAQRWIDKWFETYPKAHEFIMYCRSCPAHNRNLYTPFGRRKRVGVVTRDNLKALQNEFANFPHQSIASDIMLLSSIEVAPRLREEWEAHPWNELYDAIYYEMPDDDEAVAASIKYVQEVITRVPRDWGLTRIPFLGDAKIGYDWGHMFNWKGSIHASLPTPS